MSNRYTRISNAVRKDNCQTYKNLAMLDLLNYIDAMQSIVEVNNCLNQYCTWSNICNCCNVKRFFNRK